MPDGCEVQTQTKRAAEAAAARKQPGIRRPSVQRQPPAVAAGSRIAPGDMDDNGPAPKRPRMTNQEGPSGRQALLLLIPPADDLSWSSLLPSH